ncbi:MAG TPA: hypothetical protein VL463_05560 [Kofleriaceae bacterium]|jgi:hypothetical protein|nr:hypothetical protein [Kofleriaceae bacterium]
MSHVKSSAAILALLGTGCSLMVQKHRALGVAADVSFAVAGAIEISSNSCDELECLDSVLEGHYVAPALIAAGAVMGLIGLAMDSSEQDAPVVARPAIPTVVDPDTRRLALLARGAAASGECGLAFELVAEVGARDPVYLQILESSGAVACSGAPKK